jgi:hypothetical protein
MVFFDLNSSTLTPQAQTTLGQAASAYKTAGGNAGVSVVGHADRSGPDAYNMALSLRRANAAKDALVRGGVPATAIAVTARGESQPLVPTADGVVEPQNRRDEIVIGKAVARDDLAYCKAMSASFRQYLGRQEPRGEVAQAMDQCDKGNAAEAIPVLEKALTDARIPLPARM